ncbi:MAG: sensor histidine kinase [Saprospiraceae bacterium]
MKTNKINIFIAIASLALFTVLFIQWNWIKDAAAQKASLFDEKAKIIQARCTEVITEDPAVNELLKNGEWQSVKPAIDSLIQLNMKYYDFNVAYSLEIVNILPPLRLQLNNPPIDTGLTAETPPACYDNSLDQLRNNNGWELKLTFPDKEKLLKTGMVVPFLCSFFLVFAVLFMFWKTIFSLRKEKLISEHTTDFLNNMTHEFKTPLTNIALAAKMIAKDSTFKQTEQTDKEPKIKHYSGIILEENEKLRLQVEQVLSMTALERGEIPIQKTELDFHHLINGALKSMSVQLENRKGILKLELEAARFVVFGDKTHLSNAICNLIDNAIKYSVHRPAITVHSKNLAQNLLLIIEDKGIGIDPEYQKKVFKKYFRVPTGDLHDVKGFGLGLAYVRKIIELHNGTIDMLSEKNKGTTFTITLPNA